MNIHTDNGGQALMKYQLLKTEQKLIPMKYGWLKKLTANGSWLLRQCISINNHNAIRSRIIKLRWNSNEALVHQ
jgi:hypothetical protein